MTERIEWATAELPVPIPLPADRVESVAPVNMRIGQYPDGTRRVQGAYPYKQGWETGIEWRDLPVVQLDSDGQEIE